jgi:hypothetical protein
MAAPLRLDVGLREAPLGAAGVSLRVLRLSAAIALAAGGGAWGGYWAVALPVAVVDRRAVPARTAFVVEAGLALRLTAVLIAVVAVIAGGRRRGRKEEEADDRGTGTPAG